jgi:hypothetical protein
MKKREIEVGGRYLAKVSGALVTVRVIEIRQIPPPRWANRSASRTLYLAVSERSGRQITIRSAQRFRAPASA